MLKPGERRWYCMLCQRGFTASHTPTGCPYKNHPVTLPDWFDLKRVQDGWMNLCSCGLGYWLRASDLQRPGKMRRFAARESDELHVCLEIKEGVLVNG